MDNLSPIRWSAPEYAFREKSTDWFWALGIAAVSIAVISILLHNILFAVFVLVGAATVALHALKEPRTVAFVINDRGVTIGKTLYPYATLESFGIDENGTPKLFLKSKKITMPFVVLPLTEELVEDVRDYLLDYLEEAEHEETFSDKLMEFLGF